MHVGFSGHYFIRVIFKVQSDQGLNLIHFKILFQTTSDYSYFWGVRSIRRQQSPKEHILKSSFRAEANSCLHTSSDNAVCPINLLARTALLTCASQGGLGHALGCPQ